MTHYHSHVVKGYKQMDIPFTMAGLTDRAERLAVLLPGAGYTTKAPLFHYSSSMFLEEAMDVLEINYPYRDDFYQDFSWEELTEAIHYDVNMVLDHVLMDKPYRQIIILAKSIGTLCMDSILRNEYAEEMKAIWVTPLLKEEGVLNALADAAYPSLCIIGDKDPNYTPEGLERIGRNPLAAARLYPNMHHGLEQEGHILNSIDLLKSIMKDIKTFI